MALVDVERHDLGPEVVPVRVLGGMRGGGELGLEPRLAAVALRHHAHLVVGGERRIRIGETSDVFGLEPPAAGFAHDPPHRRQVVGMS